MSRKGKKRHNRGLLERQAEHRRRRQVRAVLRGGRPKLVRGVNYGSKAEEFLGG